MSEITNSASIKEKALQSGKWALLARASQVLGGGLLMVILPYWLVPDEYGIITMLTSVLSLGMLVQQAGFSEATIQVNKQAENLRNTAFWLNIFSSAVLYILLFLLSPWISEFFHEAGIVFALRITGLQIILAGITNIPMAWLQRTYRFKVFALIHFFSSVGMIVVALALAVRGSGYWGYILGLLFGALVKLILVALVSDWSPAIHFDLNHGIRVLKFSSFVLLEMFFGWLLVWFDNVVVARHLGSAAAGTYSLAFNIAILSISIPCSAITGLSLPTFSRLQNDRDLLRHAYLIGTSLVAAYAIPAGIGISLLGGWLVRLIYPQQWMGLSLLLSVLGLYSGFGHLWILNTDVFKSLGKPAVMVKIYIPVIIVMIPLYWWSSQIGLLEFTITRSLVVLVGAFPHIYYAIHYLGLSNNYFWRAIRAPLIAATIMAVFVFGSTKLLEQNLLSGGLLGFFAIVALVFIGAMVYIAVLWKLAPNFVQQSYQFVLQFTGRTFT